MKFQIISTLDGSSTSTTDLFGLSQNVKFGILCRVEDDGSLTHMGLITNWDLVRFSRTWAGWVNPEPTQEVSLCFELVDRWLEVEGSVSVEELEAAARAAAGTTRVAAWDARAAAWAAWAAAESTAGDVAWATAWAAKGGAAWAGRAATRAAARARAEAPMYQRQGELVLETLASR